MTNLPEGLYLRINRVVERPCPTCYVGLGEDVICDICNRTGLYKVRVRGWVEIITHGDGSHEPWSVFGFDETFTPGVNNKWMRDLIVSRHLDGTLPPEIAANITKEGCDE